MSAKAEIGPVPEGVVRRLAPSGVLRAGINLSNFLLVSSRDPDGGPVGVSPDLAHALADALGLDLRYVTYPSPGLLADAAAHDEWDVALVGAEPQRAETIAFTPAYAEIEATYLVPEGSRLHAHEAVDAPGVRIAVTDRTAYGLWLERNIRSATLVRTTNFDDAMAALLDRRADALAGLRPRLISDQAAHPTTRLLEGRFMAVQQAIGVPRAKGEALPYLERFVAGTRASGYIAGLIQRHGVRGLSVATG